MKMSYADFNSSDKSGSKDKTPLPVGRYDDLEIVSHGISAKKDDAKDPALDRHWFLVASDSVDGTAFLYLNLKPQWQHPAVLAIVFNAVESMVNSKEITVDDVEKANAWLDAQVAEKVTAAN